MGTSNHVTTAEAALMLGISERAVQYRLGRGLLKGINLGGRAWQIDRQSVAEAKRAGRLRPGPDSSAGLGTAASKSRVHWKVELDVLHDLNRCARLNHVWTFEALKERMRVAEGEPGGIKVQRVLLAKMTEEAVSAVEDSGAFALSFRQRRRGGFLRQMLNYQPAGVGGFFRLVHEGTTLEQLLELPSRSVLLRHVPDEQQIKWNEGFEAIRHNLNELAQWYLNNPAIRSYNKLKHGFLVLQDPSVVLPEATLPTDPTKTVSIILVIDDDGNVRYSPIDFLSTTITQLERVITASAHVWEQLVYLASLMYEWGIPMFRRASRHADVK